MALSLLQVPATAAAPLNPPIDLSTDFSFPAPDQLLGPAIVGCAAGNKCLSLPDVLEAGAASGARILLDQVGTASPGDYLFGTASQLGLQDTPALRAALSELFAQAAIDYDSWFEAADAVASNLAGPPQLHALPQWKKDQILAYARTRDGKICSIAVRAYQAAKLDETALAKTLLLVSKSIYRTACLRPLPAADDEMLGRLVYFVDGDLVACGGLIVSGNLVLTARHCFAPGEAGWVTQYQITGAMPADIDIREVPHRRAVVLGQGGVYVAAVPNQPFNGSSKFNPIRDAGSDYLFVELVDYQGPALGPIRIVAPHPADGLLLPGFQMTGDALLAGITDRLPSELLAWERDAVRVDPSPLCAVMAVVDQCGIHSCQTEQGYSGTPILTSSASGISLVGVHTGLFSQFFPPPCGFTRGGYFKNYGVIPPQEVLAAALAYAQ